MLKNAPNFVLAYSDPQRTKSTPRALVSLRPRWLAFLSILEDYLWTH